MVCCFYGHCIVMTEQRAFREIMMHQKRANVTLTIVNSWFGVWHMCACPPLCRPSLVQTSIRLWQSFIANANSFCHQSLGLPGWYDRVWILEGMSSGGSQVSAHPSFSINLQDEQLNQWQLSYLACAAQFNWLSVYKYLGQTSSFVSSR